MAKTNYIELPTGETMPILYEDRAILAIDKPRGWMLVPFSWQKTSRNLQAALVSSIAARDFWARSRNLKFLRYIHRLDAETSGILLFAKSQGALNAYGDLFESRRMEKVYLAVTHGIPRQPEWTCRLKLAPDTRRHGRMRVDPRHGKAAETAFRLLQHHEARLRTSSQSGRVVPRASAGTPKEPAREPVRQHFSLIEAHPFTGRTHQIRVHLAESGCPIVGDEVYAADFKDGRFELGLRAVSLAFNDPFTRRRIAIRAPFADFCAEYGFSESDVTREPASPPRRDEISLD